MAIRNKEDAQRVMRHVPDVKRFYCHDGEILNNIYDLKTALSKMHVSTYRHHVTDEKNDFARWVREVLGDDKLSHDMERSQDQKEAAAAVSERITWLREKA